MNSRSLLCSLALAVVLPLGACDRSGTPQPTARSGGSGGGRGEAAAVLPAALFVDSIGGAPVAVAEAKASAKEGDKVVLAGHIGGRDDPFVAGRASFTLVDPTLSPCADGCKTPWDFCCESQKDIAANAATVQVVGADGQVVRAAIDGHRGLKPGAEVVIAGTVAKRDNAAVLIVNADQIWVKGG